MKSRQIPHLRQTAAAAEPHRQWRRTPRCGGPPDNVLSYTPASSGAARPPVPLAPAALHACVQRLQCLYEAIATWHHWHCVPTCRFLRFGPAAAANPAAPSEAAAAGCVEQRGATSSSRRDSSSAARAGCGEAAAAGARTALRDSARDRLATATPGVRSLHRPSLMSLKQKNQFYPRWNCCMCADVNG